MNLQQATIFQALRSTQNLNMVDFQVTGPRSIQLRGNFFKFSWKKKFGKQQRAMQQEVKLRPKLQSEVN